MFFDYFNDKYHLKYMTQTCRSLFLYVNTGSDVYIYQALLIVIDIYKWCRQYGLLFSNWPVFSSFLEKYHIDMVIDWDIFKTNLFTFFPCFIFIPKTGA